MALNPEEARVLACLIEKELTVPDSYPLTLNSLRLACNQSTNRHPVVAYEDRTVEAALMALKSVGLVRFVHPSHGGRTIRYRHVADERWHLDRGALAVLAVLVLRGPQTIGEVRSRTERQVATADGGTGSVEELLDELAARSPEPFAVRLERRPGERDARWAHLLGGEVDDVDPAGPVARAGDGRLASGEPDVTTSSLAASEASGLAVEVAELRRRLDRLERLLGVEEEHPEEEPPSAGGDQPSSDSCSSSERLFMQ